MDKMNTQSPANIANVANMTMLDRWHQTILDTAENDNTARTYCHALEEFDSWYSAAGRPAMSKAVLTRYKNYLLKRKLSPSTVNVKLSAVRKLIKQVGEDGGIDKATLQDILDVKGVDVKGVRMGNWLSQEDAERLLNAPPIDTLRGLRDRALLAVLLGTGLRRAEAASLKVSHIQQREGRWVIVDIIGKRDKVRSVPLPAWAKVAIDAWTSRAGITTGPVFLAVEKGDKLAEPHRAISASSIWRIVRAYADQLNLNNLAPHDLRRTAAKMMRSGGAPLEQISVTLGHEHLETTRKYLGVKLDIVNAATDKIQLRLFTEDEG